jgi:hypothetical protein
VLITPLTLIPVDILEAVFRDILGGFLLGLVLLVPVLYGLWVWRDIRRMIRSW